MNPFAKIKRIDAAMTEMLARMDALERRLSEAIDTKPPIVPATLPAPVPAKRRGRPPKVRPEG